MNTPEFALTENLFAAFGLDKLEPEQQEAALRQLGDVLFKRVMLRLSDELSEDQLAGLDQALKREEQESGVVVQFLRAEVSNADQLINEEIAAFKAETMDLAQYIK